MADEEHHPITYNHYYTDNIQQARSDSQKAGLQSALTSTLENGWSSKIDTITDTSQMKKFLNCLQPKICVDMDAQACEEALAGLNAYYKVCSPQAHFSDAPSNRHVKVAMKTFVDNICRQVVERHILSPLPEIFWPATISQLSDDELVRIGTEPEKEIARRQKLSASAQGLRSSLVDLQSISG